MSRPMAEHRTRIDLSVCFPRWCGPNGGCRTRGIRTPVRGPVQARLTDRGTQMPEYALHYVIDASSAESFLRQTGGPSAQMLLVITPNTRYAHQLARRGRSPADGC